MKVKELRKLLDSVDDELEVIVDLTPTFYEAMVTLKWGDTALVDEVDDSEFHYSDYEYPEPESHDAFIIGV